MPAPELSIVMPCLNEAESLPHCLQKAIKFLSENKIDGEIIVADNGSTDDSEQIAREMNVRIVSVTEKGYGSALMSGIENAKGKYVIMGDADDSYDFSNILPFIKLLREGSGLVIGNRFKGGIKKGAMPFLHRYIGNPVLSFTGRLFFNIPVNDFHCGLRGFDREQIIGLDLRSTGMEFASEMIVKAAMKKLKIAETPVVLYPDKRTRRSHLRTWRDGWRHLRFLLLFNPRWLFLYPGLLLLLLGLLGSVLLSLGPIHIGNKKIDVHTLVYASGFILIGFQFISFYFFSRLYAATSGLMPHQEKFIEQFQRRFHLEKGILAGIILFAAGIFFLIRSFLYWKNVQFGDLDPVVVLRWVVPSSALMVLGLQVIISCFYLSFLMIRRKNN